MCMYYLLGKCLVYTLIFTVITSHSIISCIDTSNIKSASWGLACASSGRFDFINVAILVLIYFLFYISLIF